MVFFFFWCSCSFFSWKGFYVCFCSLSRGVSWWGLWESGRGGSNSHGHDGRGCGKAGACQFAVQTPGSQRFSMGSSSIFSGSRVKAQKCAKKILGHKRGGARRGLVFPLGALVLTSEQISLGGFYAEYSRRCCDRRPSAADSSRRCSASRASAASALAAATAAF